MRRSPRGRAVFKTIGRYQHVVAEAQSRPGPKVRHPLLTWHLGFWNASGGSGDPEKTHVETVAAGDGAGATPPYQEARLRYIDSVGRRIAQCCLSPVPQAPSRPGRGAPDEGADKPGLVPINFDWYFFRGTLRFEHHSEYFTLSVLLDLSRQEGREKATAANVPPELASVVEELRRLKEIAAFSDDQKFRTDYRDNFAGISEAAFALVWERFYREVLLTTEEEVAAIGGVFADFRGIVLSDRTPGPSIARSGISHWLPQRRYPDVQEPFWREPKQLRRSLSRAPREDDYWKKRYDLLWPLMTAKFRGMEFQDYEFTASLFSEGRALYLSALGAQPEFRTPEEERIPLCYGLYTHDLGGWAIGRLIEQINQQGTLRLASLYDLSGLEKAATPLRNAEFAVRQAFGRPITIPVGDEDKGASRQTQSMISIGESEPATSAAPPVDPPRENPVLLLAQTQRWMTEADKKVLGGVEYRIERSRYYILRFHKGMAALQIRPFGDMQPYNAFVERRLGPAFGYVEMLSSRYERVRRDIRSLTQQCLVEAIHQRNVETKTLQKVADAIIYPVLLPYYLGMLLSHTAFARYEHGMPVGYWCILWVGLAMIPAIDRRHRQMRLRKPLISLLVCLLAMLFILRVFGEPEWVWRLEERPELAAASPSSTMTSKADPGPAGATRTNGYSTTGPSDADRSNEKEKKGDSKQGRQKQEGPRRSQ